MIPAFAIILAQQAVAPRDLTTYQLGVMAVIFVAVAFLTWAWWRPVRGFILRREEGYGNILQGALLMDVQPRTFTLLTLGGMILLAVLAWSAVHHIVMVLLGLAVGAVLPALLLRFLKRRRLYQLEEQLVDGIQTVTSGVRAGLNLIQAMELLARNGVRPISEEFQHLLREYEHGMSFERAMANAANRMGSSNYRLLFSALLTHRERGGDLGETLDRIAESIREIHRLEKKIETLTAPGRAAARWMGAMPAVILLIMYCIEPDAVSMLFTEDSGKLILLAIIVLNIVGFLWIRKIVAIDI